MKKGILLLMIGTLLLTGCGEKENNTKKEDTNKRITSSFIDIKWTRDAEQDIETIRFSKDGSFAYSCSCGNPVNDADLCETYTYDEKTHEIKLDCFETTEDTITTIKVVSATDTILELDFNGEIRKFEKESE